MAWGEITAYVIAGIAVVLGMVGLAVAVCGMDKDKDKD